MLFRSGTVTSGIWNGTKIGLAYGGTNTDLSSTGGTGQYLKQTSTGATITVGTIGAADYTITTATPMSNGYLKGSSSLDTFITSIPNADLANSTISGIALGGNLANLTATDTSLTFSATYTGASAATIGLNLGNANVWTNTHTFQQAVATTQTDGIILKTTSTATSGNQKYSPSLHFESSGYGTTGAAAQLVDWIAYVVPVQGTSAPTATLNLDFSVNGGAYANRYTFSSAGALTAQTSVNTSYLYL